MIIGAYSHFALRFGSRAIEAHSIRGIDSYEDYSVCSSLRGGRDHGRIRCAAGRRGTFRGQQRSSTCDHSGRGSRRLGELTAGCLRSGLAREGRVHPRYPCAEDSVCGHLDP